MNGRAGEPDRRGNTRDRARRKLWLLHTFGDGDTVPCYHCGKSLDVKTCEADRIIPGGSYRRDNIIPACRRCNSRRGNKPLSNGSVAPLSAGTGVTTPGDATGRGDAATTSATPNTVR